MKISAKQYAKALLESVLSAPDKEKEIIKRFASLLFKSGKSSMLPAIVEHFELLWNEHHNISDVEIISARQLSDEVYKMLEKKAAVMAGVDKIEAKKTLDPKILGGAVLRYQDKVLDMSLYTKFEHLKDTLKG